jgi:hypothetical protein
MSPLRITEGSAPSTPAAGKLSVYGKTGEKKLYAKNDAGEEHLLSQDQFGFDIFIGDGVNLISTGVNGYLEIPFDCEITSVRLLAKESGAIVVDIWKDTYANYPPTNADSITSATPPTIVASGQKYEDTTLSGWTTDIAEGDILGINVDSVDTITEVCLSIRGKKT